MVAIFIITIHIEIVIFPYFEKKKQIGFERTINLANVKVKGKIKKFRLQQPKKGAKTKPTVVVDLKITCIMRSRFTVALVFPLLWHSRSGETY